MSRFTPGVPITGRGSVGNGNVHVGGPLQKSSEGWPQVVVGATIDDLQKCGKTTLWQCLVRNGNDLGRWVAAEISCVWQRKRPHAITPSLAPGSKKKKRKNLRLPQPKESQTNNKKNLCGKIFLWMERHNRCQWSKRWHDYDLRLPTTIISFAVIDRDTRLSQRVTSLSTGSKLNFDIIYV